MALDTNKTAVLTGVTQELTRIGVILTSLIARTPGADTDRQIAHDQMLHGVYTALQDAAREATKATFAPVSEDFTVLVGVDEIFLQLNIENFNSLGVVKRVEVYYAGGLAASSDGTPTPGERVYTFARGLHTGLMQCQVLMLALDGSTVAENDFMLDVPDLAPTHSADAFVTFGQFAASGWGGIARQQP